MTDRSPRYVELRLTTNKAILLQFGLTSVFVFVTVGTAVLSMYRILNHHFGVPADTLLYYFVPQQIAWTVGMTIAVGRLRHCRLAASLTLIAGTGFMLTWFLVFGLPPILLKTMHLYREKADSITKLIWAIAMPILWMVIYAAIFAGRPRDACVKTRRDDHPPDTNQEEPLHTEERDI